jgi:hypothetical protein
MAAEVRMAVVPSVGAVEPRSTTTMLRPVVVVAPPLQPAATPATLLVVAAVPHQWSSRPPPSPAVSRTPENLHAESRSGSGQWELADARPVALAQRSTSGQFQMIP